MIWKGYGYFGVFFGGTVETHEKSVWIAILWR
jgi:hypothetical protein